LVDKSIDCEYFKELKDTHKKIINPNNLKNIENLENKNTDILIDKSTDCEYFKELKDTHKKINNQHTLKKIQALEDKKPNNIEPLTDFQEKAQLFKSKSTQSSPRITK